VGKLKFDVYIIDETGNPISEIAKDLATDDPGFTGYYVWNVVFQKRSDGQPLATATPSSGTPSPSATPGTPTTTPPLEPGTPSPTATPDGTTPSGLPTTGTERLTMSIPENVRKMLAAQVSPVSFVLEIEVKTGGEEE
jgi:hypothetical protein